VTGFWDLTQRLGGTAFELTVLYCWTNLPADVEALRSPERILASQKTDLILPVVFSSFRTRMKGRVVQTEAPQTLIHALFVSFIRSSPA
jgi:hypothetical protein